VLGWVGPCSFIGEQRGGDRGGSGGGGAPGGGEDAEREEAVEVGSGGVVEQELGERHGGRERRVKWQS
jgi:hypothetical protein